VAKTVNAEKSFECSLETIKDVRHWIVDVLSVEHTPENIMNDVVLATSEAVTNAVVHGYEKTRRGRVDLSVQVSNDSIVLTVRDYGAGFGQKSYTAPDTSSPHEGGYGVYLVHKLMDEVTLSSHEKGTELRMKKVTKPNKDE
jgi:anti-sigma regulatory factor (Ser/Thr protein kinase)